MDTLTQAIYAAGVLLAGGAIKGVFGIGLPLFAIPLLTLIFNVATAGAIMVAPVAVTNIQQIFTGGREAVVRRLRRYGLMCVIILVTIIPASRLIVVLPEKLIYLAIGITVLGMSALTHFRPTFRITESQERWIGPVVGVLSGVIGGLTTFYGPIVMVYVLSLRLPRDQFVGDISLLYFVAVLGFGIGIGVTGVGDLNLLMLSLLAVIPTVIGNWVGLKVRARMSEHNYSNALLVLYIIVGASFLIRAAT